MTQMTLSAETNPGKLISRLQRLVESGVFQGVIIGLILVNAIILGLQTSKTASAYLEPWLTWVDQAILAVFVVELLLRLAAYRWRFFKDAWSLFDLVVVVIALMPTGGPYSVLRALRVIRVIRLVSVVPSMRKVVQALLASLPGLGAIVALMVLIFYVAAVMATNLFGEAFPDWFGTLGNSLYSLFQIMTLESWSMGIVRPVMEVYPSAWLFFVGFILISTFTMLNLFIAVVVSAMQRQYESTHHEDEAAAEQEQSNQRYDQLLQEIQSLRQEISTLQNQDQSDRQGA